MSMITKKTALLAISISALLLSGCLSSQIGSSSLAHVVIEDIPMEPIRETTKRVLIDDYYRLEFETANMMVFERDATQRDKILWGHFGGQDIRMRIEFTFETLHRNRILVRADAFVFRGRHAPHKIMHPGRRPYQKLLDQIRANVITSGKN